MPAAPTFAVENLYNTGSSNLDNDRLLRSNSLFGAAEVALGVPHGNTLYSRADHHSLELPCYVDNEEGGNGEEDAHDNFLTQHTASGLRKDQERETGVEVAMGEDCSSTLSPSNAPVGVVGGNVLLATPTPSMAGLGTTDAIIAANIASRITKPVLSRVNIKKRRF